MVKQYGALFLTLSISYSLVIQEALPADLDVENTITGEKNSAQLSQAIALGILLESWQICIQSAEAQRSNRDKDFFLATRRVINPKSLFIAHSQKNEEYFCAQIRSCEVYFGKSYSVLNGAYSPCQLQ